MAKQQNEMKSQAESEAFAEPFNGNKSAKSEVRKPKVGDSIDYCLGTGSGHKGEFRPAVVTKILGDEVIQFNVHCAELNDFSHQRLPTFPVAASHAPYDATGKPGTWRFRE